MCSLFLTTDKIINESTKRSRKSNWHGEGRMGAASLCNGEESLQCLAQLQPESPTAYPNGAVLCATGYSKT